MASHFVIQKPKTLFGPVYQQIAAELCDEEIDYINSFVEANCKLYSNDHLLWLLMTEMPLCLEQDIKQQQYIALRALLNPIPHVPAVTNIPIATNLSPKYSKGLQDTEDPLNDLQSKWTSKELAALNKYLDETAGRKNWVYCARLVGSKSSSQCKSKFNNMRAKELIEAEFDL